MEYFDVVDKYGNPTGELVERKLAHRTGVPHRTAHIWIFRYRAGKLQVLLQKRCKDKDSYPGCYDISSAGHVTAGQDVQTSALRELKEELGVTVEPSRLIDCGYHNFHAEDNFRGVPYIDNQVSRIYILWLDREAEDFTLQPEEIESVRWMDFEECKEGVRTNAFPNCMDLGELAVLENRIAQDQQ